MNSYVYSGFALKATCNSYFFMFMMSASFIAANFEGVFCEPMATKLVA